MNELSNTATAAGNYNSIPTSLTSNISTVNMIEGLTMTKTADKQNWVTGDLTYTIVIDNKTDKAYENPKVTDIINNSLVEFVNDSVTINGVKAEASKYTYDDGAHTLTVTLDSINPSTTTTLTFSVTKKS